MRIIGHLEKGEAPPDGLVLPGDSEATLYTLVRVRRRMCLYKPPMLPESGRFSEYHPSQV